MRMAHAAFPYGNLHGWYTTGPVSVCGAVWPPPQWWPANTVLAYQSKNCPTQLDSCTNLANPGTHDLDVPLGLTAPAWTCPEGWLFNAGRESDCYETHRSQLVVDRTYSMAVRARAHPDTLTTPNPGQRAPIDQSLAFAPYFNVIMTSYYAPFTPAYFGSDFTRENLAIFHLGSNADSLNDHVYGWAGTNAFLDGVNMGPLLPIGNYNAGALLVGSVWPNTFNGTNGRANWTYIPAICLVHSVLSDGDMATLSAAMLAI